MYSVAHPKEDAEQIHWFTARENQPKSIGHSYTLPHNIYERSQIAAWIRLLCEMVGFRMRRSQLESNTLHVYIRKPDLEFISKEKNFRDFTNDSDELYKRALFILNRLKMNNVAVRALGVTARNLVPKVSGFLFDKHKKREYVLNAQDKINERFGDWTLHPASIIGIR